MKIASFDVFDTVLTRAVGSPESNFLLLGRRLKALAKIDCSAEGFARLRADAEARAFANAGGLDSRVNLRQIYAEVRTSLRLTQAECDELMRIELEHENQVLRSVPRAIDLLQTTRDRNHQIAFLSDMYLGGEVIQKQLAEHGILSKLDRCYVSCDYAKSKASGKLFQELLDREKIAPEAVSHCGNNAWADVHAAKQIGLNVHPFPEGNLNRYEEILESYTWTTEGLSSVLAGASRLTRLTVPATSAREIALRDVSVSVAAPLLVGIVLWVLETAQKLGLKRLYFVARDGQLLLEIARRLIQKLDYDCELRYLYGSRQAWLLPSVTKVDEEHLAGIFTGKLTLDLNVISVRVALARLCIVPEDIKESLASIGLIEESDWSRDLSRNERLALNQLVLEDPKVQKLVLQKAAEKRQLLTRYLEQEGLLDAEEYGVVDLGTGATLHYALSSVLEAAGKKAPVSFYLGLRGNQLENRYRRPEAYLFDRQPNLGFFTLPELVTLLEMVCSADHGSVIGYQDGDRITPVLKEAGNPLVMDWGYAIVRESIACFADNLLLDSNLVNLGADLRSACIKIFEEFWLNPSHEEAAAWGSFPMEDGWGKESFSLCLAQPYRWRDLIHPLWHGDIGGRRHWWYKGALALTSTSIRFLFKACLRVGKWQRKIRQQLELGQRLKRSLKQLSLSTAK